MKILFVVIIYGLILLAQSNTCGGNCPSNTCDKCWCETNKNMVNISDWCGKHSTWSQQCCKCIVSHESGGNAFAQRQSQNNSVDLGLWQIPGIVWPYCSQGKPPCDAALSLKCALYLYNGNH